MMALFEYFVDPRTTIAIMYCEHAIPICHLVFVPSLHIGTHYRSSLIPVCSDPPVPSSQSSTELVVVSVLFVMSLLGNIIMTVVIILLVKRLQYLLSGKK